MLLLILSKSSGEADHVEHLGVDLKLGGGFEKSIAETSDGLNPWKG